MILFANCVYTVTKRYYNAGQFQSIATPIFIPLIAANGNKMTPAANTRQYNTANCISEICSGDLK
jgi:hypothetical protein